MSYFLHDTHLHLDLYDDIESFITSIECNSIYTIAVTNLPVLFDKLVKKVHSKYIRVALGFHPDLVHEYKRYVPLMWEYLDRSKYIGEVGLSLKGVSSENRDFQIQFLKELVIRCNNIGGKILSIHSQNSVADVLTIIKNYNNCTFILHWYSGTLSNLEIAVNIGCFFSINYAMMTSKKGIEIIKRIPLNKILLESDGPFIEIDNKLYFPSDVGRLVSRLAFVLSVDIHLVEYNLSMSFRSLLCDSKVRE